jgi:hypothetical protein
MKYLPLAMLLLTLHSSAEELEDSGLGDGSLMDSRGDIYYPQGDGTFTDAYGSAFTPIGEDGLYTDALGNLLQASPAALARPGRTPPASRRAGAPGTPGEGDPGSDDAWWKPPVEDGLGADLGDPEGKAGSAEDRWSRMYLGPDSGYLDRSPDRETDADAPGGSGARQAPAESGRR